MSSRYVDNRNRRKRWFAALGFLGLFLLFSHQNCAPTGGMAMKPAGVDSLPVDIIDDSKNVAGLSFAAKEFDLHAQTNEVNLDGICTQQQEGAVFGWIVHSLNSDGTQGAEFARGQTRCASGSFGVDLSPTQQLVCDRKYLVTAQLGLGTPGQTVVMRRCLAANVGDGSIYKAAIVPQSSNVSCVVEKSESNQCAVVCYSDDGIVRGVQNLEANSCSI